MINHLKVLLLVAPLALAIASTPVPSPSDEVGTPCSQVETCIYYTAFNGTYGGTFTITGTKEDGECNCVEEGDAPPEEQPIQSCHLKKACNVNVDIDYNPASGEWHLFAGNCLNTADVFAVGATVNTCGGSAGPYVTTLYFAGCTFVRGIAQAEIWCAPDACQTGECPE